MPRRSTRAVFFVMCLLCTPAAADQAAGPAARILTHPATEPDSFFCQPSFEWLEDFGDINTFEPGDTLTFEFAVVPLRSGTTAITLYTGGPNNTTLAGVAFKDGIVAGLPYTPLRWNDVTVVVRFASQDYLVTVNGATAGPFAIDTCEGGCFTVRGWSFYATDYVPGAAGWLDSVKLVGRRAASGELVGITGLNFDPCNVWALTARGGGVLFANPPAWLARR